MSLDDGPVAGPRELPDPGPGVQRRIAAGFAVSMLGAAGFATVYALGGQVQLEGASLAVAFAGLAYGFNAWVKLMPPGPYVAEREPMVASAPLRRATVSEVHRLDEPIRVAALPRRMLVAAIGTLGVAGLFPLRSLVRSGRQPVQALASTPWRDGVHVVDSSGKRVRAGDLGLGSLVTVFPESYPEADDASTILVRLAPADLHLPADRMAWTVDGIVAYSKICTHAGCPIGLYTDETNELLCPCHQSTFNARTGATVLFGPAPRPLPQLPLGQDGDGYLVARGDFPEPVGPGYWSRP